MPESVHRPVSIRACAEPAFSVVFSTAVDISDHEGGMAMDILFKPRVEATEQMAQNCMDILQSKNQRERKIASK